MSAFDVDLVCAQLDFFTCGMAPASPCFVPRRGFFYRFGQASPLGRSFGFQFCFWKNRAPAIPYSKSVLAFRQTRLVSALIALASCVEREPSSRQYGLGATDFNRRPT